MPESLGTSVPFAPLGDADHETPWLEPYPDAIVEDPTDPSLGPEATAEALDAVRLAFVVAIQALPPRQRAVLLLRDVVGLSADETAKAIESSTAATNSALQRARARLAVGFPDGPPGPLTLDDEGRRLLARYIETWEAGDVAGFVALLARDAVWAMPPWREWFIGREPIADFLTWAWRRAGDRQRLVPTTANGQPAFGYYRPARNGAGLEAFAIQVIDVDAQAVRTITNFVEPRLFSAFALPQRLASPGDESSGSSRIDTGRATFDRSPSSEDSSHDRFRRDLKPGVYLDRRD